MGKYVRLSKSLKDRGILIKPDEVFKNIKDNDVTKGDGDTTTHVDIDEIDLAIKKEKLKSLTIDNQERENSLVPRRYVEDFMVFITQLFSEKMKEKLQAEEYNLLSEQLIKELEAYVNSKHIEHIISDEAIKLTEEVLRTNNKQEEQYNI